MNVKPDKLKAFLADAGLVTAEEFESAREQAETAGKHVGDILVTEGYVSQDELSRVRAHLLGIPFVNLEGEDIPEDVLKIVPEPIARTHNVVAYRKRDDELEVAMLDPDDIRTIEFLKKKAGVTIRPRLTTEQSIKDALQQYQENLETEFGEIINQEAGKDTEVSAAPEESEEAEEEELEEKAEELPVIRIVDTLIKHAILQRASDIHIEPTDKEVIVRYRIDGILHDAMTLPKQLASGIVARIKVLSDLKLDQHRLPQDGRFKTEGEDYKYSVRVSIMPIMEGEKVVMRLLPETAETYTLEELGLRDNALERVQDNLRRPVGMILVTGPTGSGKTTTLYTMMEILNEPSVNIATVEDPIEYRMPRISQTQVKPDIGLTFANGLRSLMRQDPDIIMVGEIRDEETAALAVNAALTGHLVLSTLHTNSAAGAIPRLIDMGVEPFLLASTLNMVIAQRLVRRLCDNKEAYGAGSAEIETLTGKHEADTYLSDIREHPEVLPEEQRDNPPAELDDVTLYKPVESDDCPDGYQGRVGIFEVLTVSETIKNMIGQHTATHEIHNQARADGMRTMMEDGFLKAVQGATSLEEVLRVTME